MRSWVRNNLLLPTWYVEQEALSAEAGEYDPLKPDCVVCSAKNKRWTNVTAYGVESEGRKDGVDYTDFVARCHGSEDIIRVEGIRWSKTVPKNASASEVLDDSNILKLAAIKALPFFKPGSEAGRCISAAAMKNFQAQSRSCT